jgi:hypothetical protein
MRQRELPRGGARWCRAQKEGRGEMGMSPLGSARPVTMGGASLVMDMGAGKNKGPHVPMSPYHTTGGVLPITANALEGVYWHCGLSVRLGYLVRRASNEPKETRYDGLKLFHPLHEAG